MHLVGAEDKTASIYDTSEGDSKDWCEIIFLCTLQAGQGNPSEFRTGPLLRWSGVIYCTACGWHGTVAVHFCVL